VVLLAAGAHAGRDAGEDRGGGKTGIVDDPDVTAAGGTHRQQDEEGDRDHGEGAGQRREPPGALPGAAKARQTIEGRGLHV
jgi:hypothetical protein